MRVVGWIGIAATLVLMGVCSYFNWAYQQMLGHGFAAALALGMAAVGIDMFKSICPVVILRAWDERNYRAMVLPSLGFAFCFSCSMISELGFLSQNRGAVVGDRETITLQYQAATRDLADAEARLREQRHVRPAGAIEAAMRAQRVDRLWSDSKNCKEPATEAARQFCKAYFTSKAELALNVEAARLSQQIDGLKAEAVRLKKAGGGADSDPQATLLAKLLPWFAFDQVTLGVNLLFPLAFEFIAAFGLVISGRLMQPPVRRSTIEPVALRRIPSRPMRFGRDSDGSLVIEG